VRSRTQWKRLLDHAAKRRIDVILVWKMDRAFRSVAHASQTLEQLRRWGVGLRSYSEPWLDTSGQSPAVELVFNILASFAQFERSLIAERVRAGMARARRQAPSAVGPPKLNGELEALRPAIEAGQLSRHQAARQLGVTHTTIGRALARADRVTSASRMPQRAY
jgi:DNA invertase Pin-like site-specific DNA recombinase